ncbi:hypothetical protein CHLNCDRAFT_55316 [Chlorella variabilis]|uniref:Pyrroloquinoline quinone-dependent pyranose dehydrogenase beta-propeller domain-containing protein n=1 Tax=Chlorella variabilis TaxID=554065 RepID=E1ZSQ1_CHLVA|nr:hypothetical protein CHLNCDRAFT_55316 [Chlorella variabilis]EFN51145.1 hypothetical protein CHLNCDRAFT_55316 [Chlorella variabilis]|eukprot:XP_005843247.1 hypothetical protein CHLNCDRAFT_55316 [Chlorella variabilis]
MPLALLLCLLGLCGHSVAFRRADFTLPPGFTIAPYIVGPIPNARSLVRSGASTRNKSITYVAAKGWDPQDITALVDLTGDGKADYAWPIVKALSPMPNGIAWSRGSLFIASQDPDVSCKLYRLDDVDSYALTKRTARLADLKLVLSSCPPTGTHGWKFIRFGPDGKLYLPIGAPCNNCLLGSYRQAAGRPLWRYGAIYSLNRDGTNLTLVARDLGQMHQHALVLHCAAGVRNTVGFDFHPTTGRLYFTDNGRDGLGDNMPDCELNVVTKPGQHFGFPFCHTSPVGGADNRPYLRLRGVGPSLVDPDENAGQTDMRCNGPDLKFSRAIQALGPHTAPLGMRFYRWSAGANFPRSYDKSIFIAQHGSWNRRQPIGARVMRVVLNSTHPTRVLKYLPFLTGGISGDKGAPTGPDPPPTGGYISRPVDVEQLADGSLLVSDDGEGAVYRISYTPPA